MEAIVSSRVVKYGYSVHCMGSKEFKIALKNVEYATLTIQGSNRGSNQRLSPRH